MLHEVTVSLSELSLFVSRHHTVPSRKAKGPVSMTIGNLASALLRQGTRSAKQGPLECMGQAGESLLLLGER